MSRPILPVLLAALLPLLGFVSEPAGTNTCSFGGVFGGGSACYSDFTANGTDWQNVQACKDVKVSVISNIASASDHDASVEVYACPAGTTTASATLCRKVGYRDSSGTPQTVLTGDQASGRDAIYGIVAQNLVADVVTTAQTTRVQIDCR